MVRGIEKFREYFGEYSGQYVFIGGTACDIILGRMGVDFRQTKDLDMVLLIEAMNELFAERFFSFIEAGKYKHIKKGTRENQFYRFEKPDNREFPYMIELFGRKPNYFQNIDSRLTPLHISDDTISLSAILLDDDYYALLTDGITIIEGLSVLKLEHLILFKMKAWLDLSERKAKGENIDIKNIKKHKNDIVRLAVNLGAKDFVEISGPVKTDAISFLQQNKEEPIDINVLGIHGVAYQDVLNTIKSCYLI